MVLLNSLLGLDPWRIGHIVPFAEKQPQSTSKLHSEYVGLGQQFQMFL